MTVYEIQKDIPVPRTLRRKPPSRKKYNFEAMEIGDFFFVPGKEKNTLGTHVSTVAKKLGIKLVTRMLYMRETLEGWKLCEYDDDGAVRGVGVWRVALPETE